MNPTTSPLDEGLTAALDKLTPYLDAAKAHGIELRPITGLMLRLGDQFGIDLDAVGAVRQEDAESYAVPLEYYDELSKAVWLLAEDESVLADVAGGDREDVDSAARVWQLQHFKTMDAEAAAMRAFIARWYEHRLEMARLYGTGDASAADA